MSNYKTVFFTLGILQIILGISMMIPILTQIIYSEIDSSFIGASIISIIFGVLFFLSNLDHDKKLNLTTSFFINCTFLVKYCNIWFFTFYFFNLELSITDAFFESMSGITTTGSTIISNLEDSPKVNSFMESYASMVRWNRYNCNGNNLMPIMNVGGMQLFKISSNDSSEKIITKI